MMQRAPERTWRALDAYTGMCWTIRKERTMATLRGLIAKETRRTGRRQPSVNGLTPAISMTVVKHYDSKSKPGVEHRTTVSVTAHCTCDGFRARQKCRHAEQSMREIGEAMVML